MVSGFTWGAPPALEDEGPQNGYKTKFGKTPASPMPSTDPMRLEHRAAVAGALRIGTSS